MALPLMPILTGIGAVTGGIKGYQESGGDLGATALGALTGGTLTRGAGGLAKTGANKLLHSNPILVNLMRTGGPLSKAIGLAPATVGAGAAGLIGLPAAAALSGKVGGAASNLVGQGAKAATGALGLAGQATGVGQPKLGAVPGYGAGQMSPSDLDQYGPPGAIDYSDPLGSIQSQLRFQNQQELQSMQNALRYAPYQEAYQQRSKEADLIRGAKAAQLATALATDSAMRQQGQIGAQRMAEGFLGNIGQAGSTQYRYF